MGFAVRRGEVVMSRVEEDLRHNGGDMVLHVGDLSYAEGKVRPVYITNPCLHVYEYRNPSCLADPHATGRWRSRTCGTASST